MLIQKEITDTATGTKFQAVGQPGTNTTHHYFTAMTWLNDSRRMVLSANVPPEGDRCDYVLYDWHTGESRLLVMDAAWGGGVVAPDNTLYYLKNNGIHALNLESGEAFTVHPGSGSREFHGPLSITNDCRTLGVYWKSEQGWQIGRIHTDSGVAETLTPGFAEPFSMANHAMVNPEHPNLVFFAHEGTTRFIPDRIWLWDTDAAQEPAREQARNLYKQHLLPDGQPGEYVGHEAWSYDGERLYFVNYSSSPLKPTGIRYVTRTGEESGHLNGDYRHWHVAPSPDGKRLVSDTETDGDKSSLILLTEVESGRSRVLCHIKRWPRHPGHPHPSFSPDGKKAVFTFADEDDCLWVGCLEI
ncbi:MAG: hypothetical protein K0R57_3079 [Paenibacillaceae bacterium]|nr:hypothetical protein [Paenibacillaceae bacterium]